MPGVEGAVHEKSKEAVPLLIFFGDECVSSPPEDCKPEPVPGASEPALVEPLCVVFTAISVPAFIWLELETVNVKFAVCEGLTVKFPLSLVSETVVFELELPWHE